MRREAATDPAGSGGVAGRDRGRGGGRGRLKKQTANNIVLCTINNNYK
jgi:hypothetical protein